jgi:hypothetical protein
MNGHDTFDARLRAAHAIALERLSPKTQAQLVQRRRRALAADEDPGVPARPALRWAVATLAICAVAIGIFHPFRGPSPAAPGLTSTKTSATAPADTTEDNPDFYVWLASSDANSLASE